MKLISLFLTIILLNQIPTGDLNYAWVQIAMLAVAAASSAYQIYQADKQQKEAKALRNQERPQFTSPTSARAALNAARLNASRRGFPGQSLAEANLRESTADAYSRVKELSSSPSQAIGSVGKLHSSEQEKIRQFGQMGAQYQAEATKDLVRANQFQTGIDQFAWMKNQYEPYMQDQAAAGALEGASSQNYYGALSSASSMAMMSMYAGGWGTGSGNNTVPRSNL